LAAADKRSSNGDKTAAEKEANNDYLNQVQKGAQQAAGAENKKTKPKRRETKQRQTKKLKRPKTTLKRMMTTGTNFSFN
jgi:predicted ribosome quality control (RQC) complex YloA/Tae2 family protein